MLTPTIPPKFKLVVRKRIMFFMLAYYAFLLAQICSIAGSQSYLCHRKDIQILELALQISKTVTGTDTPRTNQSRISAPDGNRWKNPLLYSLDDFDLLFC